MHLPIRVWEAKRSEVPKGTKLRSFLEQFCGDVPTHVRRGTTTLVLLSGKQGHGVSSAAGIIAKACPSP